MLRRQGHLRRQRQPLDCASLQGRARRAVFTATRWATRRSVGIARLQQHARVQTCIVAVAQQMTMTSTKQEAPEAPVDFPIPRGETAGAVCVLEDVR